ncbi:MAG: MFS transporter, partial [Patescibacteria group bacterium]
HVSTYWLGLSLTLGGLVAIIASTYAHRLEKILGTPKASFIAAIIPAYLYIAMSVFATPAFAVVIFVLTFGLISLQDPILAAYNNRQIPSSIRATTLSTINMFSSIYITIMGLIIGVIADYSVTYAFLFIGTLILIAAFVFRIREEKPITLSPQSY